MLTSHRHAPLRVLFVLLLFAGLSFSLATPAYADDRSYTIDRVRIDATVDEEGTLHVSEKRTYNFDGSFNGVYQRLASLPEGGEIGLESLSVECSGVRDDLPEIPFDTDWRDNPASAPSGHYSFDKGKLTVYAFKRMSWETCDITFNYHMSNAVQFYDDAAELYWQFIGDEWDEPNRNIDVRVTLPVPEGEKASAGENVLIYGHGPLDGDISLSTGIVHARVPEAGDGDFAEMRVLYPREWGNPSENAPNVHKGKHLDEAKAEEDKYVDPFVRRVRNIAIGIGAAVVSIFAIFWRFGREYRPKFKEKYWRDVPERSLHPAVVTRIWNWNKEDKDIPVTLMHLSNIGAIKLLDVSGPQYAPFNEEEKFAIVKVKNFSGELTKIDKLVRDFLFDTVAPKAYGAFKWREELIETIEIKRNHIVFFSDFKEVAEWDTEIYSEGMTKISDEISEQVKQLRAFEDTGDTIGDYFAGGALLLFVVAGILLLSPVFWLGIVCAVFAAIFIPLAFAMRRRSRYANEIMAKSKALKRWLEDFSRIDERPITDVKLWGEFMVYAAAFGVADKAYEQLRAVVPSVASDSDFAATTGVWVSSGSYGDSSSTPFDLFSNSVEGAAATAYAVNSDSGGGGFSDGGGGGFSGGGGGGFGGGGGGAF